MGYKKEENIQSLDHLEVPKTFEKFIADLPDRYVNGSISKGTEAQVDREWKVFRRGMRKNHRIFGKKMIAFSISIAAALCIFIGSTFVSPAMAQIVSTIPYLNNLFESRPLFEEIKQALDEKKYQYGQLGISIRDKEVTVRFEGSVEYYQQVKSRVEDLIEDILKARNNDAYKVRVFHDPGTSKIFKKLDQMFEEAGIRENKKITGIVADVLKQYGYGPNGIGVSNGKIHLDYIPNTEKRLEEIKSEILKRLEQEQVKNYKIKFYLYDPKLQEREGRLLPLFHTISEGLTAKSEYKVSGTGYTNSKKRFYIAVQTTLSSSDSDKEEVVENIEKTIQDFLQSNEAKTTIKEDIYEIVIFSKDQKKLKTIKN